MVQINGKSLDLAGTGLQQVINELGYKPGQFVVEYNMDIIRKDSYGDIVLKDGDTVEIVTFMGGGC